MKLIIAGANSFIGNEVLTQALITPTITSVVAISSPLIQSTDPRVESLSLEEFLEHQPSVSSRLADADACVWTIGENASTNNHLPGSSIADYTMESIKRLCRLAGNEQKRIRFVQTSSSLLEKDCRNSPTLFTDPKYEADAVGSDVFEFANANSHAIQAFLVNSSAVLPKQDPVMDIVMRALPNIQVELMAAAMLDIAVHGYYERRDLEQAQNASGGKRRSDDDDLDSLRKKNKPTGL